MNQKTKAAFTLIELLVVVLIIGILAAVAVPQYQKAVAKAHVTEAIVAMKTLTDAEEVYYLANGEYTANLDELEMEISTTSKYFSYSCIDDNYPSCLALPLVEGYPVLEFQLLHKIGSRGLPHNAGKHWCQVDQIAMSESAKAKALAICRTFGPQDPDITKFEFHLIK